LNAPIKNCRRCGRPVEVYAEHYDTFEGTHWLCFHLEFEHDADPDAPCADIGCPWTAIKIYRDKLNELGISPDKVLEAALYGLTYPPSAGA
jgi:hypothetical protein